MIPGQLGGHEKGVLGTARWHLAPTALVWGIGTDDALRCYDFLVGLMLVADALCLGGSSVAVKKFFRRGKIIPICLTQQVGTGVLEDIIHALSGVSLLSVFLFLIQ